MNSKGTYIICPKGKFDVQFYNKNNRTGGIIKHKSFNIEPNWDLKCFLQYQENILFIGYTNSPYDFYSYELNEEKFLYNRQINNGLYAYSWNTTTMDNSDGLKQMFAIVKDGNYFCLKDLRITVKQGVDFGYNGIKKKDLSELKSNYLATFISDHLGFYYINYKDQ